jgi:hypothetical protein
MGARARRVLRTMHQGLQAIGRCVGQLTVIALVILLFLAPIVALLMTSVYASVGVTELIGGGTFMIFVCFWVFIALIGWYVSPHVQPRISEAVRALLKSD